MGGFLQRNGKLMAAAAGGIAAGVWYNKVAKPAAIAQAKAQALAQVPSQSAVPTPPQAQTPVAPQGAVQTQSGEDIPTWVVNAVKGTRDVGKNLKAGMDVTGKVIAPHAQYMWNGTQHHAKQIGGLIGQHWNNLFNK